MIALLDYGSGNLRSVEKALQKVGAHVRRCQGPEGMADAQGVVLPRVGAFDDCMQALHRQGLWDALQAYLGSQRPFLGICVGYQALFERSEEFQSRAAGLALFRGSAALGVPVVGIYCSTDPGSTGVHGPAAINLGGVGRPPTPAEVVAALARGGLEL